MGNTKLREGLEHDQEGRDRKTVAHVTQDAHRRPL